MISQKVYEDLNREYGKVASWSLWAEVGETPTSNTGDMSLFLDREILKKLRNDLVFVALNASVHEDRKDSYTGSWANFHSDDNKAQRDFKLRYALVNTPFEGQYITDVIKNHPDKNSAAVIKYVEEHPETATENIKVLKKELTILGGNPVIIALGQDAYNILKNNLDENDTLLLMTHYSDYRNKESLRVEAIDLLLNEKSLKGLIKDKVEDLKADRDKQIITIERLEKENEVRKKLAKENNKIKKISK
ncbi:MAG: hypothetical protein KC455_11590 [Carnobacterium sp.]|nr:hypothetical protein [Carnobacterium sp.]